MGASQTSLTLPSAWFIMKALLLLLVPLVSAGVPPPYPLGQGTGNEKYIPYTEKTCYTQQREQCKEVYEKNCTAVIDEFEERECFDVTELMCSLVEEHPVRDGGRDVH